MLIKPPDIVSPICNPTFDEYATLVGEGVNCYPTDEAFEGVAANYVSLSAGHRYSGGVDLTTNLVVKSGTYNVIASGEWGVMNWVPDPITFYLGQPDGSFIRDEKMIRVLRA